METARYNRQVALQGREFADREKKQVSEDERLKLNTRIANGELIDPLTVKTIPGLTKSDQDSVVSSIHQAQKNPDYRAVLQSVETDFPVQVGETSLQYKTRNEMKIQTLAAYNAIMVANPGMNKAAAYAEARKPAMQAQVAATVDKIMLPYKHEESTHKTQPNALSKYIPSFSGSGASEKSAPKENDTRTNSHGDNLVFKGGKWQLAPPSK